MNRSTFFDRSDPVPVPISNSVPFLVPFHQSPFQFQFQFQFQTSHNFKTFLSDCMICLLSFYFFFGGSGIGICLASCNYPFSFPQLERIDRSDWWFVKFSLQNLERRSVKVPKFGTTIRNDVKITTFRHALPVGL